jgi:hypothetical protein
MKAVWGGFELCWAQVPLRTSQASSNRETFTLLSAAEEIQELRAPYRAPPAYSSKQNSPLSDEGKFLERGFSTVVHGSGARYSAGRPKARPQSLANRIDFESSAHAGDELLQFPPVNRVSRPSARLRSQICSGR